MLHLTLGLLLDDGGRELARLVAGVAIVALLALLLAVATPAVLLAGAGIFTATFLSPVTEHQATPAYLRPAAVNRPTSAAAHPPTPAAVNLPTPTGSAPVEIARRYLGVPYVFGGSDPALGLDCSGLVQLVYRQMGIALPRTAQLQYEATARVAPEGLQPGDLVFFARTYADPHAWITHVGIYLGDGLQINAPTEGQRVSIQPVFSGFWGAHFAAGGRVRAG